jgi:thiopeptide-type bacteriocin biosynthesis protein
MATASTPRATADSVLAVLGGVPLQRAAARIHISAADLAEAIEVYEAAGYVALEAQAAACSWYQVHIQFSSWDTAEHAAATSLGPHLTRMQNQGMIGAWWFIRKAPCWRLRLLPGPAAAGMKPGISRLLNGLVTMGVVRSWQTTIYESESAAFGGSAGMDIAHALFYADSHHILDYVHRRSSAMADEPVAGRRELSLLLCATLLRGAGQDWYEQGDIWHRVAQLRPLPAATPPSRIGELTGSLAKLMTADTRPGGLLCGPGGPLAPAASWVAAFASAGGALGAATARGNLERGVRAILAHHVIFHWNRLGLTDRTQGILAKAARDTILDQNSSLPSAPSPEGQ